MVTHTQDYLLKLDTIIKCTASDDDKLYNIYLLNQNYYFLMEKYKKIQKDIQKTNCIRKINDDIHTLFLENKLNYPIKVYEFDLSYEESDLSLRESIAKARIILKIGQFDIKYDDVYKSNEKFDGIYDNYCAISVNDIIGYYKNFYGIENDEYETNRYTDEEEKTRDSYLSKLEKSLRKKDYEMLKIIFKFIIDIIAFERH